MNTLYLEECRVSDPLFWLEACGAVVALDDPEWRLLDDPENPGSSVDFLSRDEALRWASSEGFKVVETNNA